MLRKVVVVLTFDDIRLTAEAGYRHGAGDQVLGSLDLGLRYQTMGISDKKTGHGEGLRSEDNLFRAALERLVRRVEDEGIK
jgi:hypothetical protein